MTDSAKLVKYDPAVHGDSAFAVIETPPPPPPPPPPTAKEARAAINLKRASEMAEKRIEGFAVKSCDT